MSHVSIFQLDDGSASSGPMVLPPSFVALREADASSTTWLLKLEKFLGGGEREALDGLRGSAAAEVADFVDTLVRDRLNSYPALRRGAICLLRSLCGSWGVLPASYTLQGEVTFHEGSPRAGGGYSDVWYGSLGDQKVAIKVIRTFNATQKLKKQLSKEAIIWKQLDHRNILPLLGVVAGITLDNGERGPSLVSPWMENGNIREFTKANPDVNRFELLLDVCEGLAYLHSEGFTHGDLKGDNVLIDDERRALLADFGFARVADASNSSDPGGTLAYMAPELFKDDRPKTRPFQEAIDIFALGILMYEVLSGRRPPCVRKGTTRGYANEGTRLEWPPWTSIPNHPVWEVIERCRAPEPMERPKLSDVVESLKNSSADSPERWSPPPASESDLSSTRQLEEPKQSDVTSSSADSPEQLSPSPVNESDPPTAQQSVTFSSPVSFISSPTLAPTPASPAQIAPCLQVRSGTFQLFFDQDGSVLRWKVMNRRTRNQGPGPRKRKTW